MVKVRIPRSEDQLLGLLVKINKRHEVNKKRSLLNGAVDMDRLVKKLNTIRSFKDHDSIRSSSNKELAHSKKKELKFISNEIKSIRNLLLTIYPDEPQIIEEWGFELNQ
jgi:hypothetical protein